MLDAASLRPEQLDLAALYNVEGVDWQVYESTLPGEIDERIAQAHIVLTNKVVIGAEAIARAEQLRLISVMATGTNNIDLAAASKQGIVVCNAQSYSMPSLMQHTWMLILALAGKVVLMQEQVREGAWQQASQFCLLDHSAVELSGKVLGVIGFGDSGRAVAAIAEAFGMKVLVAQRPGSEHCPDGRVPLEVLLRESDVVSIHCPLTEHSAGLIASAELALMKAGAFIVNTARGGIIDECALAEALREGEIAGAALDVLSTEPPPANHPLLAADVPNLILTPHSAWGSIESRQRLVDQLCAVVEGFVAGNIVQQVNA
ncbi:glycerate dehydrogenase [Sinobacterium caligoides]|uniref:Glycerate dehydrogenase n=2 Tax=Sinobacterium caligoides TaxID=933926 RepID=A0A3N2DZJ6_9GAMM|nr:glycerate dehydrogenase [Sinobacterium caligoides]